MKLIDSYILFCASNDVLSQSSTIIMLNISIWDNVDSVHLNYNSFSS